MSSKDDDDKEYPCLIRVTDGKETKLSTVVRLFESLRLPYLHHAHHVSSGSANGAGEVPCRVWNALEVIHVDSPKTGQEA